MMKTAWLLLTITGCESEEIPMSDYKFVNPYNFIPLEKERAYAQKEEKVYSGVIRYSILTRTPLFIPNTSNDHALYPNELEHKSYEFFSYTDLSKNDNKKQGLPWPVIPGSEMRGMLRNNFEILTNSCMSAIDDKIILSKRTNEVFKAGLLKKTDKGYDLYAAEDCLMRTAGENNLDCTKWVSDNKHYILKCYKQEKLQEGEKVFLDVKRRKGKPLAENVMQCTISSNINANKEIRRTIGYVIKGEDGPEMKRDKLKQQKHCCHIFCPKGKIKENISLICLDNALIQYKNHEIHEYKEYAENLKKFKKEGKVNEFFPVYFSKANETSDYFFLSPSSITREIYETSLRKIIKEHKTCTDKNNLCPACALFGIIGKNFQVSSRIRVSDLTCDIGNKDVKAEECYDECVTLKPLATPKLSNVEFYLKRPEDAWFWTYDYYIDKNGNVITALPEVNGRKFYWHQTNVQLNGQEKTKLNISIRPVKERIRFKGNVFFDKISKTELDQLIYLLNVGDEEPLEDKKHGYKLGAAKPLGLGSIAVSVNEVKLLSYCKDSQKRTILRKEEVYDNYVEPTFGETIKKDFAFMTNFNAVQGKNVSYPLPDNPDREGNYNIFDWFSDNHKAYKNKDGKKSFFTMPNERKQMVFMEYMEAMKPELVAIEELKQLKEGLQSEDEGACGKRKEIVNASLIEKATVIRRSQSGNLVIKVKERQGTISCKNDINGEMEHLKKDDTINVRFVRKKSYPDGNIAYFYDWVK